MSKRVIVIGGGMAGTSAALTLRNYGYNVTIIEMNDYIGGRVHSHIVDGSPVEMGAGFLTPLYNNIHNLLKDSGLETQLYSQHRTNGILRDGQTRMATLSTLMGNRALSWKAKLRLIPILVRVLAHWQHLDHHAFWKGSVLDNRTVTDMFNQADDELLNYLFQPMLNAYFYWMPEHTSEALLLILCKAGIRQSGAYALMPGLQRIPEKAAEGSTILLGSRAISVQQKAPDSFEVKVKIKNDTKVLHADGIVCATTASVVPSIFSDLSPAEADFFESIQYSSTAVVAQTFARTQTTVDKGIAFPRVEGVGLAAITLGQHSDVATLKIYSSGTIGGSLCAQNDAAIVQALTSAMEPVRGEVFIGNPSPVATHVQRWPEAIPFFDVGHFKRLKEFEDGNIENLNRAIAFAGDYLGGPFMEGAFTSGMKAAERVHKRLSIS